MESHTLSKKQNKKKLKESKLIKSKYLIAIYFTIQYNQSVLVGFKAVSQSLNLNNNKNNLQLII